MSNCTLTFPEDVLYSLLSVECVHQYNYYCGVVGCIINSYLCKNCFLHVPNHMSGLGGPIHIITPATTVTIHLN